MRNHRIFGASIRLTGIVLRLPVMLPVLALLGACGIGPQVKELPANYDLGPQRPMSRRIRASAPCCCCPA